MNIEPLGSILGEIQQQHFAGTLNDRTTRVPRGLTQIKGWVAIAEAAHMLKIQGQRLRVALDSNRIQGEVRSSGAQRDFCFIRQSEIDRIKTERSNYCSGRDVQRRLDITKIQLIRLVEAGAFHRYDEEQRPPLVDFDYLESEVIAFLDSLEKFYEFRAIEPSHRKNMSDVVVTRASNAQQVLLVYQHIVKGNLRARAIDTNGKGLNRFIFDADEINEVCAVDLGGTTLTMTQVCEITGWKSEVLSQWIKAGLLTAKYIPNGATKATLIRMDDLIRFMQNHLVLADVASAGKTKSSFLIKSLESRDCPVMSFKNDAGVRFGVLMRHADLANVIRKSTAANECAA